MQRNKNSYLMKNNLKPTSTPSFHHAGAGQNRCHGSSDEFFHGDMRKGVYLRRRAAYLMQAESSNSPPPSGASLSTGAAGAAD